MIMISTAGIDEMKNREPGAPPVEQADVPGNGNGQNPNVPIDDGLPILFMAVLLYGDYKIKN